MLQAVTQIDLIPAADSWQGSPPPALLPSLRSSPLVPWDGAHGDNYIISGQSRSPPRLWGQITLPDTDTCLYCLVWLYATTQYGSDAGRSIMHGAARECHKPAEEQPKYLFYLWYFLVIFIYFRPKNYIFCFIFIILLLGFEDRYNNCEALDSWWIKMV